MPTDLPEVVHVTLDSLYELTTHSDLGVGLSAANPKNLNMVKKLSLAMLTQVRLFIFTYLSYRLWFLYLDLNQ